MRRRPDRPDLLRIGSRGSALALRQSGMVREALIAANPGLRVEIEIIRTTGDRQQHWNATPAALGSTGGKGIFVKEIEEALIERRVDAAVHSMKDLPTELAAGLHLAAIPEREDPRDALVTAGGIPFESLPQGARIGTGSPRRITQLLHLRRDLIFVPIRGNVDTRLRKVREGAFDGAILALAGLRRLGLAGPEVFPLSTETCLPAPGQGALAIEAREEKGPLAECLQRLHHPETAACVAAERSFLARLEGGCLIPAAALAALTEGRLILKTLVCDAEGERLVRAAAGGDPSEAGAIGRRAADSALDDGAREILQAIRGGSGA